MYLGIIEKKMCKSFIENLYNIIKGRKIRFR